MGYLLALRIARHILCPSSHQTILTQFLHCREAGHRQRYFYYGRKSFVKFDSMTYLFTAMRLDLSALFMHQVLLSLVVRVGLVSLRSLLDDTSPSSDEWLCPRANGQFSGLGLAESGGQVIPGITGGSGDLGKPSGLGICQTRHRGDRTTRLKLDRSVT